MTGLMRHEGQRGHQEHRLGAAEHVATHGRERYGAALDQLQVLRTLVAERGRVVDGDGDLASGLLVDPIDEVGYRDTVGGLRREGRGKVPLVFLGLSGARGKNEGHGSGHGNGDPLHGNPPSASIALECSAVGNRDHASRHRTCRAARVRVRVAILRPVRRTGRLGEGRIRCNPMASSRRIAAASEWSHLPTEAPSFCHGRTDRTATGFLPSRPASFGKYRPHRRRAVACPLSPPPFGTCRGH